MAKTKLSKYQIKHIQYVNNRVAKASSDFELIGKGDKILVAISGGKDSFVLLESLATLRKYHFMDFDIEAIHINVNDVSYNTDTEYLNALCNSLNVKLHIVNIDSGIEDNNGKSPCFICSWHRRKALFIFAEENNFKKLALGHHMDDAVETLLINMAYHANISSLPARLSMFDGKIVIIRPLILVSNKETQEYANIMDYKKQLEVCPYEDKTRRATARNLIDNLKV